MVCRSMETGYHLSLALQSAAKQFWVSGKDKKEGMDAMSKEQEQVDTLHVGKSYSILAVQFDSLFQGQTACICGQFFHRIFAITVGHLSREVEPTDRRESRAQNRTQLKMSVPR